MAEIDVRGQSHDRSDVSDAAARSASAAERNLTLAELGARQLEALADGGAFSTDLPRITQIFTELLGAAATRPARGAPAYPSDVVDDHTPYELSVTVGGAVPELRLLVETAGHDTSLAGRWKAARAAGGWLRDNHGADLTRLDAIADLYEPQDEQNGLLALWHAVAFRPNAAPEVKAYLDLRARGAENRLGLLEETLARLQLSSAYPRLMREAARRGGQLDELVYFSLDLTSHERARAKVYFRHHHATAEDAARVVGQLGGVMSGDVRAFCTTILGDAGPYMARPLVSCWVFSGGTEPSGATLYAPVAYYVRNDAEAHARVHRWLDRQGMSTEAYDRYVGGFARRPLAAGVGMHSYVSFKRDHGAPKMTFYLAPEAYRVFAPGVLAARTMPPPPRPRTPEELVRRYETVERIADHPLFRRVEREAPAVAPLWAILANSWVGTGSTFARWLASLVSRVEDDRMRTILAKQLNDELGDGQPDKAHRLLFQSMLADLEPYAPKGDRERFLAPGRRLAKRLAEHYLERPALEAVGGTLVMEVYGKQVDQRIGDLLRRQTELDTSTLTWLVLHETLEEEHADESIDLARMTPQDPESQAAVCRGAETLVQIAYEYLDDIYEVLFA
jgi:DMATS type aromatic prenyltransferase